MARRAEGWKLVLRGDIYRVRFTYEGKRYEITTGERDPGKAAVVAARIYADVVAGRVTVSLSGALVHPTTKVAEVCADWLAAIESELGRNTGVTYLVYAKHWSKFFETMGGINTGTISNYARERLKHVQRPTVIKEQSALGRFLTWCFEQGIVRSVPVINPPPKKAMGKRHPQGRKGPTPLTTEQVEAILAQLPERSRTRDRKAILVRPRFVFAFETALRPEMIDQLEERDLTAFGLHIRAEVDKNRWDRTVPLSERAAEALRAGITGNPTARIFGEHDLRVTFRKAAKAALGVADGKRVTPYDLKHARVTAWRSAGRDPLGIQFLTGVIEAIEEYMHPNRTAAERVLRGDSGALPEDDCAKGGTRTPTGVTPLAPQASVGLKRGEQIAPSTPGIRAGNGIGSSHSGAAPQFTPEEFRARSAAWFRRTA